MRVCYFGTYRAEYSRNQIMIEGLRRAGVEVIECQEPLWRGIEDRVHVASGGWLRPSFAWRMLQTYARLLRRYCGVKDYDVLIIGYPGQADAFLARVLSWLRHRPLVWDVFMSIYLIAIERGLDRRSPLTVASIRKLERLACRLPNRLILDTEDYVSWFWTVHGVESEHFRLVPTGADDRVFRPSGKDRDRPEIVRVVYYGTFIPNHGVEHIVEAAHLLAHEAGIHFELIGQGPEKERVEALARSYELTNMSFVEWLDRPALLSRLANADICLGVFGTTPQSLMTIQNKIYEGMAMAKPVITGDSPAVRRALRHGEHVYLVRRADGSALADAIRTLCSDPALRHRLATEGHRLFQEHFSLQHIGQCYAGHLSELLDEVARAA
jgi:glycosyltransferase involved in cell wall biosynthesis